MQPALLPPSSPLSPASTHLISIGALYPGSDRGLLADVLTARALGVTAYPVCTSIVCASQDLVSDVTDVPADTVAVQLEHLAKTNAPNAVKIGALANHKTVDAVFRRVSDLAGPAVFDVVTRGPSGETLLTERGIDALLAHLAVPDLVLFTRRDAELVMGAEIKSLDDAQVAAQRAHRKGARRVVIKCGTLPTRFFDAADDPGAAPADAFHSDVYYDGEDFALFEAPALPVEGVRGASSAHAVAALIGLTSGFLPEEALQYAKRYVTEALRTAPQRDGYGWLNYQWPTITKDERRL